ncbi:TlpA family protein disulfide reductase [Undibacterium umbellatum]|uniref:TlpA family protein disulfide reductase n=1 Tax=Undibacterium umbellatum TaxID=2762300 RepID=A0ABR6ZBT9_9BURK|nr:TlpA disulfide reductase family protein [Undibacterium umbellatum]MBC3908791.1 TlpA family protein disulfide reductase [Undibacterium umbellatum]
MKKAKLLSAITATVLAIASFSAAAQANKDTQQMSFQGAELNGKKIALSDYAGKTLLVSFFTAGCNLCARDLKLMRDFYNRNVKRNFVLLAINIDADKKDFDSYVQLINLAVPVEQRFPIIWRNTPGYKDNFGTIVNQPTHFVINPKGQLVLKREGTFQPNDWDNLWESLGS